MRIRLPWRARASAGATGDERVAAAQAEVDLSRERLAEARETVVKPLREFAEHNNFAALIAQSLAEGHRRRGTAG